MRKYDPGDSGYRQQFLRKSCQNLRPCAEQKDAAETLNRLQNGALIICKASEMNNKTVDTMYKALQQENQGIVIILEDTRKEIDRFLESMRNCRKASLPAWMSKHSAMIHW